MSKGAVSQVIQRAIGDAAFRRQLQGDPKKALAGFDLTTDERSAITSGDPGRLTALGVDQRMSKAFNLSGISAASKSAVSPDLTGAGASSLIDEGSAAGRATSAIDTGGASANAVNLRRIEGDLDTVGSARQPVDVSGDFNAFDPGVVTKQPAAIIPEPGVSGAMSADGTSIDAGYVGALNTGTSAYEATATESSDLSGQLGHKAVDPGLSGTSAANSGATAFEPEAGSGLDLSMIDPGIVSGESAAREGTGIQADLGQLGRSGALDAGGHNISE